MGLLTRAKEKAIELKEEHGDGLVANAAMAKVREVLALLDAALPLMREAGCAPTGVDVDVGLPPKVVANFASADVSQEAIARITAENPDKKLACAILKALAQGVRLQKNLEVGQLHASTVGVEIGLPPYLKLSFVSG